jgi:hypothetical protein
MIFPSTFPLLNPNYAEKQVFHAMEQLGGDFDVFYSKSFARKHPKEALLYEIDFLVFDLRGGRLNHIFVFEVKGGNMSYNAKSNKWKSGDYYLDISPENQVMDYVKNLIARYYYTIAGKVPVTWLLWFPDGLKGKKEYLPSHLSHWRVLDQYSLKEPIQHLDCVIDALKDDVKEFSGVDLELYETHIKAELTKSFTLAANLQSVLDQMQMSFALLEQQQKNFFSSLMGIQRLAVEGCAGSGKSFLAKSAASEFANAGKKVLFICFNRFLKHQSIKFLPKEAEVDTILNFMREYIVKKDPQWIRNYTTQHEKNLEIDIPTKFNQVLKSSPVHADDRFDAIIIDEGQDMNGAWVKLLLKFLKGKGQAFIFYDPMQNIFNRDFALPSSEAWIPIQLNHNHRNAKSINAFINETLDLTIQSGAVPEGLPIKIKSYFEGELLEKLDNLLVQLIRYRKANPQQITVLVDGSTKDWDFGNLKLASGLQLKWLLPDEELRPDEISLTSVNHFKGSESDIIILILREPLHPVKNRKLRYTQLSRAKGGLWVLEKK